MRWNPFLTRVTSYWRSLWSQPSDSGSQPTTSIPVLAAELEKKTNTPKAVISEESELYAELMEDVWVGFENRLAFERWTDSR